MELKEKAVELFKSTATMMPTQVVQKAASSLADSKTPTGVKVPILTNDPEVQRFVDEFELYKPEKMVQFLIQGGFAQFECIMDTVNELKEIDLINSHSFIKAAQRHYKRAMANESKFDAELSSAMDKLDQGLPQLEDKAIYYVNQIRAIDNRPKLSFFVRAKLDIKKVDLNNHCAKAAIKSVMNGYNLLIAIESALHLDTQSTIEELENFQSKILADDNCSLMHAYDDDKATEFWTTLSDQFDNAIDNSDLLTDFLSSSKENEDEFIDYDNIDFNS